MTTQSHHNAIKNKVLTENNALRVHMYLKANEADRPYRLPRWIWELLQNARDASTVFDIQLETEIKYNQKELIFLHNGSRFAEEQIAHLIFHGSTKIEDEETIGQYGSGFLTTHLLSPVIKVSGQLDDGQYFNFCLQRKPDSPDAVRESMDQAWDDYTHSLSDEKPPIPEPFTTQFIYPIINEDATEAVNAGLKTLEQCAPFVVAFNPNFLRINIERSGESQSFEVDKRTPLDHDGFHEIVVTENRNESYRKGKYLLAEDHQVSVTVPLESNDEHSICLSVDEYTPRIFKEFPLVGTESFSFPAVINSLDFATKEERDGIRLGLNDADPGNIENQSVIENSCILLVRLLGHAALSGWHHTHRWAKIPTIQDEKWVDEKWLKECIRSRFLARILDTPVVLNKTNSAMLTTESKIPVAESNKDINVLFDLLEDWKEYSEKLPRQQEAIGWCETIKSWTNVLEMKDLTLKHEVDVLTFYGGIDGRGLALHLEEKTKNRQGWGRIDILQRLLHSHVCEIKWIDKFCRFLRDNGFDNVIREHRIVPDQEGFFRELPILKRDLGIDKDLMEIEKLLNLRFKGSLRDTRITSLTEEKGDGDADNQFLLRMLIEELQKRSDNNSDNNFKKASAQLFAWIVRQNQDHWNLVRNVPVVTEDNKFHRSLLIASPENKPVLAPIRAWSKDLQEFSDLFPPSRILNDAFFEALPDPNTWQMLDKAHLIPQNMIIHYNSKNLNRFSPEIYMDDDDTGDHEAVNPFLATTVLAWQEIMERVTDSSARGRLFWNFLTKWLIKKDLQGLEAKEAVCSLCGQNTTHKYYSAQWLEAVQKNKWIRQGNLRVPADEKSLANLLKDSEDIQSSLDEHPTVDKLLKAIGLNFSVLKLEFVVAGDEEKRNEVFDIATKVYRSSPQLTQYIQEDEDLPRTLEELLNENQGDVSQLKLVSQDFKDDKKLPKLLEDRRKHRQKWRDNQSLGAEVEKLVKENLEQVGFSVKRTGTGSDFEISEDTDDITQLEIEGGVQSWLVEVKSTKTENDYQYVRMTSTQAENAVKEKEGFLLCVVPLGQENPTPENVRRNMRFIQNIGKRLTQLYENLNSLEDWRDQITTDEGSGVQLIVEAGKAGFLVQKSVWESDQAFPLKKLAEYLR